MTFDHKWFVAEAIFHARVSNESAEISSVFENLLFLVSAADHQGGVAKAEAIARAKEHSYPNKSGDLVTWTFVRLVELTEMIDQRFEDGAELKSTMRDRGESGDALL